MSNAAISDREVLHRLRAEYDLAFRQWAAAVDLFHGRSELPDGQDASQSQELSMCVEAAATLYCEARNRYAAALLERQAQRDSRRPQSRAAAAAFATGERTIANGATFLGCREPGIAARCFLAE